MVKFIFITLILFSGFFFKDVYSKDLSLKEILFEKTLSNLKGPNLNYKEARRYLFGTLHLKKTSSGKYFIKDRYCNKVFSRNAGVGPKLIPNHLLINCEHTWPQSRFNKSFSIKLQKNDLHHLYPVDARANSTRLNHIFSEVSNPKVVYSDCLISKQGKAIGTSILAFEPSDDHKGNIARAIFYFSIRYKSPISEIEEFYLRRWHENDPVDFEEQKRNNEIMKIQKNRNPFIDNPALVGMIRDF